MRILRLTNSSDTRDRVSEEHRSAAVAERLVAGLTGESVDTVVRTIWPGPGLPGAVDEWIARYEPDAVFMRCAAFWCSYESVPLKIQRRFGRPGAKVASIGFKAGGSGTLNSYRGFRAMRRLAVRTYGGEFYFRPEEAAEIVESVMRRVIAHESVVPALRGPGFPRDASGTSAGFERARVRNEALDDALAAMAASLHIPYEPGDRAPIPGELSDDELHSNEAQHRRLGELEGRLIARAWLAARDGVHAPD